MKFLSKLFGNMSLDVNKIVDNLHTSAEEKAEMKRKFEQIFLEARANAEEQITRRCEADAKAGWLPANIRPLTLAFLGLASEVKLGIFFFVGLINIKIAILGVQPILGAVPLCIMFGVKRKLVPALPVKDSTEPPLATIESTKEGGTRLFGKTGGGYPFIAPGWFL